MSNKQNVSTQSSVDLFPGGVPNLPAMEEEILTFWRETNAFKHSVEMRSPDKSYVFYDGPPFATGMPHYGHLLGSTSKDVIPRYWTMKGYRVERVWGWDCHGLPIENMIEKKLEIKGGKKGIEDLGIDRFNQACELEVLRLDKEWERIIERLGRWVDFEHNYKTMDTNYMESVWWGFKQLYDKGLVYQGKKVVLYCPRCATPLSNFEIAMDNSYQAVTDNSVYISFKLKHPLESTKPEYVLAWTTTPWTLPGNVGLAVNPTATYSLVETNSTRLWIAQKLLATVLADDSYQEIATRKGTDLVGSSYEPLFAVIESDKPNGWTIQAADFVSLEDGTGIVHTAALYGEDDYALAQSVDLPLVQTLDDQGRFLPSVPLVAGQFYKKAEPAIMADLENRGLLWKKEPIVHSYPFCYRCATPLYYNAVPAWFINVQKLKSELLAANKSMHWYPDHLKEGRFGKGLATAPDWNISRSRYWGTPMPVWVGQGRDQSGNDVEMRRIIGSLEELKKWAVFPEEVKKIENIHREYLDHIKVWVDDEKTVAGTRIPEVFDCWVESGSMPFASRHYPFENKEEFEKTYPAQFVSEYIAQTRAWFYTMHVLSVGIFGKPAVENTLTTGTILAEDGSKMSKSKNNYPDPMAVINQYGVDSLRLYLMSSTVMKAENLNFNEKEVSDLRKKVFIIWYNCVSFYKLVAGNTPVQLFEYEPKPLHCMDRWLVARVRRACEDITLYMDNYDVVKGSREIIALVDDLSTWYVRRSRERLKNDDTKAVQQLYGWSLVMTALVAAPITPFFSEFIFHQLVSNQTSVHHQDWPLLTTSAADNELLSQMKLVKKVVEKGLSARSEAGIKVRQPLTKLVIQIQNSAQAGGVTLPDDLLEVIAQEVNVKSIIWNTSNEAKPSDEEHIKETPFTQPDDLEFSVTLDTVITPLLQAEGEARELMRSIQQLRKKAGLQVHDKAKVLAPNWPDSWKQEIELKTNVTLEKGSSLELST